uniref:Uncharacterized protein n=1 Tax=Kalanchoe fedtschenkoi TaxID=63787 RepID=A0A7N1A932_KALFE
MSAAPSSSSSSSPALICHGIDDVEDFDFMHMDGGMSLDLSGEVVDYVRAGNQAFRNNRFEQAICCYTEANTLKPGDPIILSNRSATYIRISEFLKHRPPAASEDRPLNGVDPTMLAEFALKDAEKVLASQSNLLRAYILKANALILLERYESARNAVLSGLQVAPTSTPLLDCLQNLEGTDASVSRRMISDRAERSDDFDCTLCLKLLYEPVTTPCGHSFCRSCLFQSMDRSNKCPLCRTVLLISPKTCAISVTLNSIIQKNFSVEYAERKSEQDSLTNLGVNLIPLFVMDAVVPCQKFALNIFEPRYRLMVRRIMEGNRRMGMVIIDSTTGSIAEYACEVEITECDPLSDGRFHIEVESRRRFRILQCWDQDGYRIAEVEWIQDEQPPDGSKEKAELLEMTNNIAEYARLWIQSKKTAVRQDRKKLYRLLSKESSMPSPQDPESFSFWFATLTDRRPSERLNLLRMRDTKKRLQLGLVYTGAN